METRDKAKAPPRPGRRRFVGAALLFITLVVASPAASTQNTSENKNTSSKDADAEKAPDLIIIPPSDPTGFRVARTLAVLLADRLRKSSGVSVAVGTDVASYFHGEITIESFRIRARRHHVRRYWDGLAIASFTIWDPRRETIVFNKQVVVKVSRRRRHSSRAEVVRLLLNQAVEQWDVAFLSLPSPQLRTRKKS